MPPSVSGGLGVSIRAPVRGATDMPPSVSGGLAVSIRAPVRGATIEG